MKIMKRLTSILALAALTLFPACENGDWSFPDYDYSTVYFAYQFPVRTLTLGNDEEYNNDLDNEHKCKIKAVLGGVYENGANRIIDIEVDNSLCDDLYFSTGEKVEPMPAGYYQLAADQIVIPKGEISGGVEVQFTDAFFADPKSLLTNYVIPLRMTDVQNADSILQGQPNVDNPDPRITSDWVEQPKNFVLYAVKYVNPWDGILLRRGVDQITAGGTTTTVVRHGATVVDDQTVEFTTRSLTEAAWSLGLGNKTCNLILKFDENNKCTLSTDTEGCTVSGTGEYVPHGEKNSFNNRDRDVIYLDYTVDLGDTKYATRDTLVMRDRQVKGEWFTVTKQ